MADPAAESWLVRVEMPHAVFGFIVVADGIVIESAPIAKWMVGRKGREVVLYLRQRGAEVEVVGVG